MASDGGAPAATQQQQPEAAGPITALWAAVFALSNLYAAVFLAIAYFNACPGQLRSIRTLLRRCSSSWCWPSRPGKRTQHDAGSSAAALGPADSAGVGAGPRGAAADVADGASGSGQDPSTATAADAAVEGLDGLRGGGDLKQPPGAATAASGSRADDDDEAISAAAAAGDADYFFGDECATITTDADEDGNEEDTTSLATHSATQSALALRSKPPQQQHRAVAPVALEWRALSFTVLGVGGKITILQGVYGDALLGELQALIGPSGAGKST